MRSTVRGIFLTSETPQQTAMFYKSVAGLLLEQVGEMREHAYWKLDQDGIQIAIHDASKFAGYAHPARPDSNLTHLYFKIEDQKQFLEHLEELNIKTLAKDEVVVTIVDPDGRKVMFGTA